MDKKTYYITTAIAYASRKPHIGNTYEIILTDAIARRKRQEGYDVFFLTGTDEHGQKIEEYAKEAGIEPKAYVDGVASTIRGIWDLMNTSYSKFIRTTDDYHEKAVAGIFKRLYEQGDIYKNEYEGWYCVPCESFFTETQAANGVCPDCGRPLRREKEEAYFFKMSKYADRLLKYIEDNPDFISPESRKKEMVNNFLKAGLQDLCVSRTSFKWGIPVEFDPKHVIYVWIDALSNYITALGYSVDEKGELYKKYWPADVHIIGKDILRFHTIYWPIILMALGEPLPKKVFGHPWLLNGTDKISKSKGNVIYADDLVKLFGVDAVRHYCLAEMPFNSDGSISYENIIARYNADLANNLGNLVNRTIAMTNKYFDGIVPTPDKSLENDIDKDLKAKAAEAYKNCGELFDSFHIADASDEAFGLLRRANKYIDETTPWTLAKDEGQKGRLGNVIYNLLETIRIGAVLIYPFIPETSEKIFSFLNTDVTSLESAKEFGGLVSGKKVGEASVLFNRIDPEVMLKTIADSIKVEEKPKKPDDANVNEISIDDFKAVELRCAKVLSCETVPKAKKLLKLTLDLGYEKRQVVSGIAKFYTSEDLIGKKVALVANLKPAVICGVESNGMILASGEDQIKVVFLDDSVPEGERIR